jgi:hypothetical protein
MQEFTLTTPPPHAERFCSCSAEQSDASGFQFIHAADHAVFLVIGKRVENRCRAFEAFEFKRNIAPGRIRQQIAALPLNRINSGL